MVTPIVNSKYRHLYQLCYVKIFSINHNRNLVLLDYPGRVRSQITSVVYQIQRFDFDCILVVSRKVILNLVLEYSCNTNTCTFTRFTNKTSIEFATRTTSIVSASA
jgi:hypothetical protein